MRNLPYLKYIRSFESSARLLSFTAAAAELNQTQAAVSGHIRSLEEYIGGPLFIRHPRSLSLTSLGAAYLPNVQQALVQLEQATDAILKRRASQKVIISCPVSLAENWLAGVVARFREQHVDVPVSIHARIWQDESPEIADIILTNVHQDDLSRAIKCLWRDDLCLVCSPNYKVNGKRLSVPAQLNEAHLISNLGRSDFWHDVMAHYGYSSQDAEDMSHASTFSTALSLASEGLGVAVVPHFVAKKQIEDKILINPFGEVVQSGWFTTISDESLFNTKSAKLLHSFIVNAAKEI